MYYFVWCGVMRVCDREKSWLETGSLAYRSRTCKRTRLSSSLRDFSLYLTSAGIIDRCPITASLFTWRHPRTQTQVFVLPEALHQTSSLSIPWLITHQSAPKGLPLEHKTLNWWRKVEGRVVMRPRWPFCLTLTLNILKGILRLLTATNLNNQKEFTWKTSNSGNKTRQISLNLKHTKKQPKSQEMGEKETVTHQPGRWLRRPRQLLYKPFNLS